jgi:hypothetical protein
MSKSDKLPVKLKYGERLQNGKAVLKTFDYGEEVKIVYVGGSSEMVPADKPVELKAAK